ncbi:hypothetical protein ACQEVM_38385 [Streptomyces sp. CA-243310]|uniref:hypothetical protein n=1 Tax=Streptomyces sp. CA-243310 TaxID=3240056 RepID=UPI003D8C3082
MFSRYLPATSLALFSVGIAAGILGMLRNHDNLMRTAIFLVLLAMPLIVVRTIRQAHEVSAEQLADAENTGYRRALDHVARGLLDQDTAPCPSPGVRKGVEPAAGNVIRIRPLPDGEERKAL